MGLLDGASLSALFYVRVGGIHAEVRMPLVLVKAAVKTYKACFPLFCLGNPGLLYDKW